MSTDEADLARTRAALEAVVETVRYHLKVGPHSHACNFRAALVRCRTDAQEALDATAKGPRP